MGLNRIISIASIFIYLIFIHLSYSRLIDIRGVLYGSYLLPLLSLLNVLVILGRGKILWIDLFISIIVFFAPFIIGFTIASQLH